MNKEGTKRTLCADFLLLGEQASRLLDSGFRALSVQRPDPSPLLSTIEDLQKNAGAKRLPLPF